MNVSSQNNTRLPVLNNFFDQPQGIRDIQQRSGGNAFHQAGSTLDVRKNTLWILYIYFEP